jgi:hypothetical protein
MLQGEPIEVCETSRSLRSRFISVWRFVGTGGLPMLKMMKRPEGMLIH